MNINIDVAGPKSIPETVHDYKNILLSYGCVNLIRQYTRIATNINNVTSKTMIDHIITNVDVSKTKSGVLHYELSDHLPIFSIINISAQRQVSQTYQLRRIYNKAGKAKFLNEIQNCMDNISNDLSGSFDPDNSLDKVISAMQTSDEKSFSFRSKNKTKKFRKPWMTSGILESMRDRDILYSEQLGKMMNQKQNYTNKSAIKW